MKILQINVVCGVKSTGRITTDIAALAEERGYDCKVAYGREKVPAPLQKYAVKIGTPFSNKCHAVLSRAFSMAGFASKTATKKLIAKIQEYDKMPAVFWYSGDQFSSLLFPPKTSLIRLSINLTIQTFWAKKCFPSLSILLYEAFTVLSKKSKFGQIS